MGMIEFIFNFVSIIAIIDFIYNTIINIANREYIELLLLAGGKREQSYIIKRMIEKLIIVIYVAYLIYKFIWR